MKEADLDLLLKHVDFVLLLDQLLLLFGNLRHKRDEFGFAVLSFDLSIIDAYYTLVCVCIQVK